MDSKNSIMCMHCGRLTNKDSSFCINCGKPLVKASQVQAENSRVNNNYAKNVYRTKTGQIKAKPPTQSKVFTGKAHYHGEKSGLGIVLFLGLAISVLIIVVAYILLF